VSHTLIYDGECGICNDSVNWTRTHLRPNADVTFVPYQQIKDLDALGLTEDDVSSAAWWIEDGDGRARGGYQAAARALQHCRGAWPAVGRMLTVWPFSLGARGVYRLVADNRGRLSRATRRGQPCPTRVGPPSS
jgi:predicted DCC family thiol-disulfide oxidoreductase YuxK